jgi:hypothetical protein
MLSTLWKEAGVGTEVFIFESDPSRIADIRGRNDLEMTP